MQSIRSEMLGLVISAVAAVVVSYGRNELGIIVGDGQNVLRTDADALKIGSLIDFFHACYLILLLKNQ